MFKLRGGNTSKLCSSLRQDLFDNVLSGSLVIGIDRTLTARLHIYLAFSSSLTESEREGRKDERQQFPKPLRLVITPQSKSHNSSIWAWKGLAFHLCFLYSIFLQPDTGCVYSNKRHKGSGQTLDHKSFLST